MKLERPKIIKYISIGVIAVFIATLWTGRKEKKTNLIRDYETIEKEGVLRAVTEYNSFSYYRNEDTVSGFYYELIHAFARDKKLKVEVIPEMSFEKRIQGLCNGHYDIIAYGIPTTSQWKDSLLLTIPIVRSKQILVQRKPDYDSASIYIKSLLDLAHKTLYVEKGSPSILRIRNLENEIADTIFIEEVEKYGLEQLIAMVAHGDIDYVVSDEKIAKASIDSFPQLDINTGISFTQFYSWGVSKQSPALRDTLDAWLTDYLQKKEYRQLHYKYFRENP